MRISVWSSDVCSSDLVGEIAIKITLVTDALTPHVNGVVRTLSTTVERLRARGHEIQTVTPDMFRTAACPGYSEIRLALMHYKRLSRLIDDFQPEVVHIATEGPLGSAARRWCGRNGRSFTTAVHTRFPAHVALRP